jgi:hypothetical protein
VGGEGAGAADEAALRVGLCHTTGLPTSLSWKLSLSAPPATPPAAPDCAEGAADDDPRTLAPEIVPGPKDPAVALRLEAPGTALISPPTTAAAADAAALAREEAVGGAPPCAPPVDRGDNSINDP